MGIIAALMLMIVLMLNGSGISSAQPPPQNPDDLTLPNATLDALQTVEIPPRDRYQLAAQLWGVDLAALPTPPNVPPLYALGDWQIFRIFDLDGGAVQEIDAQLVALGEHIALWVQEGENINADELASLAQAFDSGIYDSVRDLWGDEPTPGIDGDPRIHGLFARGVGGSVLAYFSSTNMHPAAIAPGSSERDLLIYSLDTIRPPFATRENESTTAHEFQHMIRANVENQTDSWMDEGLAVYTQLHLGYDDVAGYTLGFMAYPWTQLNAWGSGANYGASLLFLTYLAERCGLKTLQTVAITATGEALADINAVLSAECGSAINSFYADWVAANWLRDSASIYGYQNPLLADLPQPLVVAAVDAYPFTFLGSAPQYGAHYIDLSVSDLPRRTSLTVTLNMPETVGLLVPEPMQDASGRFWYSHRADDSTPTLTHTLDLTAATSTTLHYRVWHDLEAYWDYAYALVSVDDGATWQPLVSSSMTDENPNLNAYGWAYTGESGGWRDEQLSLDAYAGQTVLLRFMVVTDESFHLPGMALDDFRVDMDGDVVYEDDFEGDLNGWQAEGWVLTDNRLPQRAWVQLMARDADGRVSVVRRLWPTDFTENRVQFDINPAWDAAALAVLPITPVTTVPADYSLTLD